MGLDVIDLFMAVENAFALDIPNHDAVTLSTVGLLYDFVVSHAPGLPDNARPGHHAGETWERFRAVVSTETGIALHELRAEAHWLTDLGLD